MSQKKNKQGNIKNPYAHLYPKKGQILELGKLYFQVVNISTKKGYLGLQQMVKKKKPGDTLDIQDEGRNKALIKAMAEARALATEVNKKRLENHADCSLEWSSVLIQTISHYFGEA